MVSALDIVAVLAVLDGGGSGSGSDLQWERRLPSQGLPRRGTSNRGTAATCRGCRCRPGPCGDLRRRW